MIYSKNNIFADTTYIGLIELFIKNGLLKHASYFLCQMDRLRMKIPRKLLDLFLDYSINNNIFERNKQSKNDRNYNIAAPNKYDSYDVIKDPNYTYYFNKRNHTIRYEDIEKVFSKLKTDAAPYFPKSVDSETMDKIKSKIESTDPSTIKEYYPKNFKNNEKVEQIK